MSDCIFCRIVQGGIPAEVVFEDEALIAIRDIHPQAPTHLLFIPKVHIPSLNDLGDGHRDLMGRLMVAATKVAQDLGLGESGYRLVVNCGPDGGQTVFHLHLHLLGGASLSGRMG